ncbi:hypothetical protein CHISP_3003 [Chitinispirillum alkaliphilum]|nr:hypothetical protein CHISP_3003 [Chitinispirillum alkaliphilum]
MDRLFVNRTENYRWPTRHDLYDYFYKIYSLEQSEIDSEIESVKDSFKIRSGEAIRPQELWQKVGKNLEHRYAGIPDSD